MVTDEKLFAWLDGELADDEAKQVADEVSADAALTRKAEAHRDLQRRLSLAFGPIATAPLPDALAAATRREAEVVDLAVARQARQQGRWSGVSHWGAAIAATLAVGIFIGIMVPHRSDDPVKLEGGKVYAAASLDQALTAQLASAPSGGTHIGLTFRDQAGSICRTFTQGPSSGLACRDGSRWLVRGLFGSPEGQSGSYRMAAGMDPNLAGLVDSTMTGDPFDASQEEAARDKGWR